MQRLSYSPRCSLMFRYLFAVLSLVLLGAGLSGCMSWLEPATRGDQAEADWPDLPSGPYYFAWRLSGDRAVGPLQVFDNGRDTWLQFMPNQALPALFGVRDEVEYLLPYQRRGPYLHVTGIWPQLVLRGGALTARADYQGNAPPAAETCATCDAAPSPTSP